MRRVCLLVASLLALDAASARAGEAKKAAPAQPYVDLRTIGFPAVVHGRLVNYIFTDIRLDVAPGLDASRIQQAEPFLLDALVRAGARTPFNPPDNGLRLDDARLQAEVMRLAAARFGPGKVVRVEIPSETPQRRTGVPGVAAPASPPG